MLRIERVRSHPLVSPRVSEGSGLKQAQDVAIHLVAVLVVLREDSRPVIEVVANALKADLPDEATLRVPLESDEDGLPLTYLD